MTRIQYGSFVHVVIHLGEVVPQAAESDQIDRLIDASSSYVDGLRQIDLGFPVLIRTNLGVCSGAIKC